MIKIFVLASGRSGTKYLAELFEHNIKNCVAKHEPRFGMFGKTIYWYQEGNIEKIRKRFLLKKKIVDRYNAAVYIETNHAFLKSFSDVAMEAFPDMKLVHLVRNPLEVAKSQYNRPIWVGELEPGFSPEPFYTYRGGDGGKYCKWALTGKEKIFQDIDIELTRYQKLLTQWIEIENRAMDFLEKYKKHNDCYTLDIPKDLNSEKKIREVFSFFGLEPKKPEIDFQGFKNPGKAPTVVTSEDKKQLQELVNHIPECYLKIFQNKPYVQFEWAKMLVK
jgi:hypothetical protein